MAEVVWRVGRLAELTGVSVRALHHYESIGLLRPAGRNRAGHRLYGEQDLRRLQQVVSLKSLGLPLEGIREMLDDSRTSPVGVIRRHVSQLRERIRLERKLCAKLERLAAALEYSGDVTIDDLMQAVKETQLVENFKRYYTPEQLEQLHKRREALGPEGMHNAQQDWQELLADAQRAVEDGMDPASPEARDIAHRWDALIEAFTGGDEGIRQSLARMYAEKPDVAADYGYRPDPRVNEFVAKARDSSGLEE